MYDISEFRKWIKIVIFLYYNRLRPSFHSKMKNRLRYFIVVLSKLCENLERKNHFYEAYKL